MKKITFDTGLEEILIGGGVLRFNPQDPNLFVRFLDASEKLQKIEAELVEKAASYEENGNDAMRLLQDADVRMKQLLSWVFGSGNDFDAILGGVNLLAIASNGERVVTNLFAALEPVMIAGAERCAESRKQEAIRKAEERRAAQ